MVKGGTLYIDLEYKSIGIDGEWVTIPGIFEKLKRSDYKHITLLNVDEGQTGQAFKLIEITAVAYRKFDDTYELSYDARSMGDISGDAVLFVNSDDGVRSHSY